MAFVFKKINPKRRKLRIAKSERSQQILDALSDYIEGGYEEPMKWLVSTWQDQANKFVYSDLYSIVTDEEFPQAVFDGWFKSYSDWITEKMTDTWKDAMMNGWKNNPVFQGMQNFTFDSSESRVRSWIQNHGAELVTNCMQEQKSAIQYLVAEAQAHGTSSAELGRYIRPTIGLTRQQAAANLNHYETVKAQLHKDHPRMSEESIEQKARASAARYAAKQQRYRAETIARTELAYAYNKGNDEAVRQAMEQRKLPIMRKVWTTAQDGNVCSVCEDLEDMEIGMDEEFKAVRGIRVKREVTCTEPPIHPRCKCAIAYEETGEYMIEPIDYPEEPDTMEQEGEDSQVPAEYTDNFDDFSEITLDQQERAAVNEVHALASESGFEYGIVTYGSTVSEPFTSSVDNRVDIPEKYANQQGLRIYHAHTNDTPFSAKDLSWLTRENVDKICVVARNGDVFVAYIGDGYRPDFEEYKNALKDLSTDANISVMGHPSFSSWSPEQRTYMAIREQVFLTARRFGWTLEGGKL